MTIYNHPNAHYTMRLQTLKNAPGEIIGYQGKVIVFVNAVTVGILDLFCASFVRSRCIGNLLTLHRFKAGVRFSPGPPDYKHIQHRAG